MKKKKWTIEQLRVAVKNSTSIRQVIGKLGLVEAGGNYAQVKKTILENKISSDHFTGMAWNKGMKGIGKPRLSLKDILVKNNDFQSFKLKKRLFMVGLKKPECEKCGWAKKALDGRIPLELDHINGDRHDNRIENLQILCPNCHSLQPTHRGKNKKRG
ncbi:MAG: H-N-H endonuclease F-TflIV [Candidatus Magasanikbacteria bacterium GW2011_GWC2_34_16]|uniref:H-N-H endonuclease F-TflIV n=2 Tax=Candidatus Magasanikiibacteriota TaxID=1752731 RepID=A0A0G0KKM2_9BACT|nr:MAG: H-N-H endonuclease F-TflIV [Candidatus Magasanikbacteria bacterium GW2011_GWC2_34_16]KKQ41121.1 MAG: H-N-H endonuclease F-TflIV [Candidatus Magasanikbacteria bacterium GW2011_GWA2_37_8]